MPWHLFAICNGLPRAWEPSPPSSNATGPFRRATRAGRAAAARADGHGLQAAAHDGRAHARRPRVAAVGGASVVVRYGEGAASASAATTARMGEAERDPKPIFFAADAKRSH